jgi:hypothetical protein
MLWKLLGYSLYLLLPFTLVLLVFMPLGFAAVVMAASYCLDRGGAASGGRQYSTEVRYDFSHGSDARDAHIRLRNWP